MKLFNIKKFDLKVLYFILIFQIFFISFLVITFQTYNHYMKNLKNWDNNSVVYIKKHFDGKNFSEIDRYLETKTILATDFYTDYTIDYYTNGKRIHSIKKEKLNSLTDSKNNNISVNKSKRIEISKNKKIYYIIIKSSYHLNVYIPKIIILKNIFLYFIIFMLLLNVQILYKLEKYNKD